MRLNTKNQLFIRPIYGKSPFYIFAPHTVSYLVKRPPVRYSYTVRERHHIIIPVKPVLSGLTFRLQMRCENVECHSSCLSCEQYGNSDLQEPYCPSAFGFRTVWLLQVRISILLPPSAGGMLHSNLTHSILHHTQ